MYYYYYFYCRRVCSPDGFALVMDVIPLTAGGGMVAVVVMVPIVDW